MLIETLVPLEYLGAGESAEVAEVAGDASWTSRLAELGVRAGSRIRVLRAGSPCLLQVGGARLSLRAENAAQILVRPLTAE